MIDPTEDKVTKIRQARKLFTDGVDHYDKARAEMHRSSRFYHNTRGRGQWEQEDLQYLDEQARPALCFNLIRPKIDTWAGMYQDGARKPMARERGGEDKMLADLLERICETIYDNADVDAVDEDILIVGCVKGEKNCHIDVRPDPTNPGDIEVTFEAISPHDIIWDPGSERADRSDAKYVFWDKWLGKGEFTQEYPEHKDEFDHLERGIDSSSEFLDSSTDEVRTESEFYQKDTDYPGEGTETYFYDRHRRKLRVVHCEYKTPVKKLYAFNPESGLSEPIESEQAELIEAFQKAGDERFAQIEVREVYHEQTYTMEFIGHKILWESKAGNPYQPYEGFSLVPFTCYWDDEDGVPYGMVRNLMDPQTEINKAHSQTLDMMVGQGAAGVMAEEGAISDVDEFEEQIHTSGSVAYVADGAISGQRVIERKLPEVSVAVEQRLERGVTMVDRISTIHTDLENPAAQQEAATTVQIRYHKSRMSMSGVVKNFERYQREVKKRVLQTIIRVMTDTQIQSLLGDDDRFIVKQGMVIEMIPDPKTGKPSPQGKPVHISDVRLLRHDIKLETTSENATLRLMELQGLMQLFQMQAPVDPMMLVEKTVTSTADKDQLRKYARTAMAAQQQSEEQQKEQAAGQVGETLRIEGSRQEEEARKNRMKEVLDMQKLTTKREIDLLEIWERADEKEKELLMEVQRMIQERQAQRAGEGKRANGSA